MLTLYLAIDLVMCRIYCFILLVSRSEFFILEKRTSYTCFTFHQLYSLKIHKSKHFIYSTLKLLLSLFHIIFVQFRFLYNHGNVDYKSTIMCRCKINEKRLDYICVYSGICVCGKILLRLMLRDFFLFPLFFIRLLKLCELIRTTE